MSVMNEKTRKVGLTGLLVVAIVWGYANYPWQRNADTEQVIAVASTASPQMSPSAPVVAQVSDSALAELSARQWGGDPFYSPGKSNSGARRATARSRTYTVKAILYSDTAPSAYINGRVVRVGDVVDGATVQSISRTAVRLLREDETITVGIKR